MEHVDEIHLGDAHEDAEASMRCHEVLIDLISSPVNFSDVHIEVGRPVKLRMPTGWQEATNCKPFTLAELNAFLTAVDEDWQANISYGAVSRAVDLASCRLRINAYHVSSGLGLAINIRRQPLSPVPLEDTGLPMYLRTMLDNPRGLILFTGPTGVGKTTSMASMLHHINLNRSAHIITIEDPIEYVHERNRAIFSQKEVKIDTPTFAQGLRDALRQKPDVIMVGEIRDRETAETVFLAAESGHLVLASLHTNSAKGSLNKMLSWFPGDEAAHRARSLADMLLCVVSQTLVPTQDGGDRALATEVLVNQSDEVANLIETPANYAKLTEYMKDGRDKMSHTLNQSLVRLVQEKTITAREALRHTNDRVELHAMLSTLSTPNSAR